MKATVETIRNLATDVTPTHVITFATDPALRKAIEGAGFELAGSHADAVDSIESAGAQECYVGCHITPARARLGTLGDVANMLYLPGPVPYGHRNAGVVELRDANGDITTRAGARAVELLVAGGIETRAWKRIGRHLDDHPDATDDDLRELRGVKKSELARGADILAAARGNTVEARQRPDHPEPIRRIDVERHLPHVRMESFDREYSLVETDDDVNELADAMASTMLCGVDTETTGLHPHLDRNLGLVIAPRPGRSYYFGDAYNLTEIPNRIRTLLEHEDFTGVYHNWTFDANRLRHWNIYPRGTIHDTISLGHLLGRRDATASFAQGQYVGGSLKLKRLVDFDLGYKMITFEEVTGGTYTLEGYPPSEVVAYACADADMTLQLFNKYYAEISAIPSLLHVYEDIEQPLFHVTPEMVWNGVGVDMTQMTAAHDRVEQEIENLLRQIWFHARGHGFEKEDLPKVLASPAKKSKLFFGDLHVPKTKKTKTGYTTARMEMEAVAYGHDIVGLYLDWSGLNKLATSFTGPMQDWEIDGSLFPGYNQNGTDTGRYSSDKPNAQNIPNHSEIAAAIRRAFIPRDGKVFVGADWAQIELRIMAAESGDKTFIEAFKNKQDPYKAAAAQFYNVPYDEVTPEQRQSMKMVVLGKNYGLGPPNLARRRRISLSAAQEFMDEYDINHPAILEYHDTQHAFAREHGYSETAEGRRRKTPMINSANISRRMHDERIAVNLPIQGGSADMLKMGLYKAAKDLDTPVLQVHDEIIIETYPDDAHIVAAHLQEIMENIAHLKHDVPILAEAKVGKNWKEVK